jgi:hypothetical protein
MVPGFILNPTIQSNYFHKFPPDSDSGDQVSNSRNLLLGHYYRNLEPDIASS